MPRPRPLILITFLLLLAGAAVNVAVAWSFSLWAEPSSGKRLAELPSWHMSFPSFGRPPHPANVLVIWEQRRSFGATASLEKTQWSGCATFAFGWPARSLAMARFAGLLETEDRWAARLTKQLSLQSPFNMSRAVPLCPLPLGFAINTLFYTAILALPLSIVPIRRLLRARRGRCPKCGYDLAGVNGRCPECGVTS